MLNELKEPFAFDEDYVSAEEGNGCDVKKLITRKMVRWNLVHRSGINPRAKDRDAG
jgi:hypothetical protein